MIPEVNRGKGNRGCGLTRLYWLLLRCRDQHKTSAQRQPVSRNNWRL